MDTKLVISELMVDMLKQFSSEDRGKRELETQKGSIQKVMRIVVQAPVVRRVDNAIHWINRYPMDSVVRFVNTYTLDSDLCGGKRYPSFEQLGPGNNTMEL